MSVHVSIHDVSPAWRDEVETALEACAAFGVKPALLVVPDFHGRAPLLADAAYCARLRGLQKEGHEIFLHGYYHRAEGGSFFRQRIVSAGEAEFAAVDEREAVRRLKAGEQVLREAGLAIDGFVAPAWSMPRWFRHVLHAHGYRYTEDHLRVYDPAQRRSRPSVVLNYASRTPGRLLSSVAWCRAARPAARVLPARVAIHPADMKFALLRSETRSLLAWATKRRIAARASDLFA